MYDAIDRTELKSPGLRRFEAMAREAYQDLPEPFRALCGDTIMRVAEFPDSAALSSSRQSVREHWQSVPLAAVPGCTAQQPKR